MSFDPERHHRVSHRLRDHDYSGPGYYFITVCVEGRECQLGSVVNAEVELSADGSFVDCQVRVCCAGRPTVLLDEYVVMPYHIHLILGIVDGAKHSRTKECGNKTEPSANAWPLQQVRPPLRGTSAGSIGAVVQNLKSITSRRINALRGTPGARFWQRDYYDHIVRSEEELDRIRKYIRDNPARWADDRENPSRSD